MKINTISIYILTEAPKQSFKSYFGFPLRITKFISISKQNENVKVANIQNKICNFIDPKNINNSPNIRIFVSMHTINPRHNLNSLLSIRARTKRAKTTVVVIKNPAKII